MGHLVRQTHIAKALRDQGHEVLFFIPNYAPAQTWLNRHHLLQQAITDDIMAAETQSLDIIILDIQDTSPGFIKQIKQGKKSIVSFEDLGEGRQHVDLLIDCNLDEDKSVNLPVQTLFGFPYSVLAQEFESFHTQQRKFKTPIESALITFGGTDPHGLTPSIAEKLLQIQPHLAITLLAGPGCKSVPALQRLASANRKVKLLESTSQMAQTLFNHSIVFCAGGVTLHEAMAVGTPAFVINQVSHQADKAQLAEDLGAAINLGMADCWDENRLPEILASSTETLNKMSQACKSLIDGKGLKRVVNAIEAIVPSCKK